jgi:hypothetical protein
MPSAMLVEIMAGLLLGIIPIGIAWRSRDSAAIVASLILMAVAGWYLLAFGDAEAIAVAATLLGGACTVSTLIHFNNTRQNREAELSDDVGAAPSETSAEQQVRDLEAPRRDRTGPDREALLERKRRLRLSSKRRRRGPRASETRTRSKA